MAEALPKAVLVIGHSFIYWLKESKPDFNIDNTEVELFGMRGLNVPRLSLELDQFTPGIYDVVYLEIGSNDICHHTCTPEILSKQIFDLAEKALQRGIARQVVIGNIKLRHGVGLARTRPDYCVVARSTNEMLANLAADSPNIKFWKSQRGELNKEKYYRPDGIHLNDEGMRVFFRELRGGLICGITRLSR